ncbi:uncharacterized protein L201_005399 [Kwoniella dendrophila CBS 6074]|uniref:Uncharacterized protein n=1 Tax=Kwoniella dendrophila CBS 6074 TaxID=1295534 RepID=A0AAX4JZ31_9TREE
MSYTVLGLGYAGQGGSSNLRRRSSFNDNACSSSDESSVWSPPDTPTPIHNIPFDKKNGLQPGRLPSTTIKSTTTKLGSPFSFTLPVAKKARVSSSSFKTYRLSSNDNEDTASETDLDDGEVTETELGTLLSDVEDHLINPSSENGNQMIEVDGSENDEVDMFLLADNKNLPPSSPISQFNDRKGKKRLRDQYEDTTMDYLDDGDDEMETEGLLSVKQKGKRPIKYSKQVPTYPKEKSSALGPAFSVVGNICDKLGDLHASSAIFAMNIDVPIRSSTTSLYPQEKIPELSSYERTCEKVNGSDKPPYISIHPHRLQNKKLTKKRGQLKTTKKCYQQLTASEDPLVNLPAFTGWTASNIRNLKSVDMTRKSSAMDISDIDAEDQDIVDEEMKSLSDIESSTAGGNSSDIDMNSVSSITLSTKTHHSFVTPVKSKIRKLHAHPGNLAKPLVDQITIATKKNTLHRKPRLNTYVERLPGQKSTSQLHRSSPSSLLPSRRYMTRSHRPPIITHKYRSRLGKVSFNHYILTGQTFISMLRSQLSFRQDRRLNMLSYNQRTKDGEWRKMIGNWWGFEQVAKSTNKWWLTIKGPDEVEVEALLSPTIPSSDQDQDEIMLSPKSFDMKDEKLNQPQKRIIEEDVNTVGSEVEERWSRRNQLRLQELQPYIASQRLQEQAKKAEQRRQRAEFIRQRLAEIAEQRRLEEVQRAEQVRSAAAAAAAEQERRRIEEARLLQEQEQRAAEQARIVNENAQAVLSIQQQQREQPSLTIPSSPASSETSTVLSDPPEYEFPIYPITLNRPNRLDHNPQPRISRIIVQARSDILPDYLPDRWNNRSPPPPPPYNARTDCQTLIAPIFIEDSDDEDGDSEDDDHDEEVDMASPLVVSTRTRLISPEPRVIGSFPSRQLFAPVPIRASSSSAMIDPIRAFENALDLEEGLEEETNIIENDLLGEIREHDDNMDEEEEEEEDVVPGSRVAGAFQRVFGMVWGNSLGR